MFMSYEQNVKQSSWKIGTGNILFENVLKFKYFGKHRPYASHDLHSAVNILFVLGLGKTQPLSTVASNGADVPVPYDQ
jgi:hypothetical protein